MKALAIRPGVPTSWLRKMSKKNIGRHTPPITVTYYILLVLKGNSFLFLFTIFTNIVHANDSVVDHFLSSWPPIVVDSDDTLVYKTITILVKTFPTRVCISYLHERCIKV